jgi:hypothetical protein
VTALLAYPSTIPNGNHSNHTRGHIATCNKVSLHRVKASKIAGDSAKMAAFSQKEIRHFIVIRAPPTLAVNAAPSLKPCN